MYANLVLSYVSTWIYFSVAGDSIRIDEVLESFGKFIGSVERRWCFTSRDVM